MNMPRFALTHTSIIAIFVLISVLMGIFNFSSMSRREDPEILIRNALIVTQWPGVSATRVDELITDVIKDAVVEIPEIVTVESESMMGMSIVKVTAGDENSNIDQIWDEVRAKVDTIRHHMPQGASPPFFNGELGDVYEVVFALYQTGNDRYSPYTQREIEKIAERIEDEVELIDDIARVEFWGNQPERIYIEFNPSETAKLGITVKELVNFFQARNILSTGGVLNTDRIRYAVKPSGEFTSIEQLKDIVVGRVDDIPIRLGDLPVTISRRYEEPVTSAVRMTTPEKAHQNALVLGISMKSGRNIVNMNAELEAKIAQLRQTVIPPDVALERVNDLPRQVNTRVVDFQINLVEGILIVLGVAFLTMGWRPALIMATAVPLSMLAAFAVVTHFGVELEQFSIASLIIALGMVVDNAIVVSDNVVRLLKKGMSKVDAVINGAQELAIPIFTSTLTTMAAFLPMLTLEGQVGEFVASLPLVVASTLGMSYLVAMLVTPIMCVWLLKSEDDSNKSNARGEKWLLRYDRAIDWCLKRPGKVVTVAGASLICSLLLIFVVGSQFFPAGARDQFFIKVWLPESSPISRTAEITAEIEQMIFDTNIDPKTKESRLVSAVSYIGTGGPRIMLTQEPEYPYPNYSLILVNTTSNEHTETFAADLRKRLTNYNKARITVDQFMLGPPVKDPVAFRLTGPDEKIIAQQANKMVEILKTTPGVVRPYSNWGSASHQVELVIDDHAANLAGITNEDIALTTSTLLSGAHLTDYREGDHLVPVLLRANREYRNSLEDLNNIFVNGEFGKVPLDAIANVVTSLQPSIIARRGGLPTVTVGARIEPGLLANTVANRIKPKLEALVKTLPPGYTIEADGELEETANAQSQVIVAVGLSVIFMFLILAIQYNSLLKPLVVMAAVPLGLIGVMLGLYVTGWAIGFMAMLGILSLGGIVINNAIVMVDFIESNMAEGAGLQKAVASAGRVRMGPILLTTATTIGGLLPLSLFGGPLWAPMTNGMIFGLFVSTILTLFVIPSLYVLMVEKAGMQAIPANNQVTA